MSCCVVIVGYYVIKCPTTGLVSTYYECFSNVWHEGVEAGFSLCSDMIWDEIDFRVESEQTPFVSDIIVAVFDSGITPESPSFSQEGYTPLGLSLTYLMEEEKSKGFIHWGDFENNRKIVFARMYKPKTPRLYDYLTCAKDAFGHGTAMASLIAGNPVQVKYKNLIEGVARGGYPCRLAIYKIFWLSEDKRTPWIDDSVLCGAFMDAIRDKVHVISLSLKANSDEAEFEMTVGSFIAMQENIPTVAAAGNEGEEVASVRNLAPWIITVGASGRARSFEAEIILGDKTKVKGVALNFCETAYEGLLASLDDTMISTSINQRSIHNRRFENKVLYYAGSRPREAIQFCEEQEAFGIILSYEKKRPYAISLQINAAYVNAVDARIIWEYIGRQREKGKVTICWSKLATGDKKLLLTPTRSSAKAPNTLCKYILKPNVCAPGSGILVAGVKNKFTIIDGTSPACAIIASHVAFVRHNRPDWTPARICSALMTTALPMKAEEGTDILAMGAGFINSAEKLLQPGLAFDCGVDEYAKYLYGQGEHEQSLREDYQYRGSCTKDDKILAQDLNLPSFVVPVPCNKAISMSFNRKVTCVSKPGKYEASIHEAHYLGAMEGVPEIFRVEPIELEFLNVEEVKDFQLTITGIFSCSSPRTYVLEWRNDDCSVRCPILFYDEK